MTTQRKSEFWLCYRPLGDESAAVELVDRARAAIVADTARRALAAGFERVRLFSTVDIAGLPSAVETERTSQRQQAGSIVAEAAGQTTGPVCYAGSGMPAMTEQDWAAVLARITSGSAVANRVFSCDWIGVPDGRLLGRTSAEQVDNRFALLVRDQAEVSLESYPHLSRSLLDVDTPADLAVLKAAAQAGSLDLGEAIQQELAGQRELDLPVRVANRVFETMTRSTEQLFVSGRVSGSVWAVVDRDTSCRVRVLSEERGLRTRGVPARSLLGALYERSTIEQFIEVLRSMGDAMIWDTRPFFSDLGWKLSRADRFSADLGAWSDVSHDGLRELLQELSDVSILMGGHSLVSGGLLAGIDTAWTRRDSERELSG